MRITCGSRYETLACLSTRTVTPIRSPSLFCNHTAGPLMSHCHALSPSLLRSYGLLAMAWHGIKAHPSHNDQFRDALWRPLWAHTAGLPSPTATLSPSLFCDTGRWLGLTSKNPSRTTISPVTPFGAHGGLTPPASSSLIDTLSPSLSCDVNSILRITCGNPGTQ